MLSIKEQRSSISIKEKRSSIFTNMEKSAPEEHGADKCSVALRSRLLASPTPHFEAGFSL